MKKMVLVVQKNAGYFPLNCDYAYVYNIFKSENYFQRILRKAILKLHLPFERLIYTDWRKNVANVNKIIIFDTGNAPEIVNYINKKYPAVKVILWYWNSISDTVPISKFAGKNVDIWTFDPADAQKYGIRKNTQFYIEENFKLNIKPIVIQDVFYVGADKNNRGKTLAVLKEYFDKNNVKYDFNLVQSGKSKSEDGIEYKKSLTYREVVEKICNSKVIIDLVAEWQSGLTLRPLEALYFRKKLITNMKSIKDYDFYNPNNIFILGVDKIDKLKTFINNEYDDINYDFYRKKYSFKEWLRRFDENESIS